MSMKDKNLSAALFKSRSTSSRNVIGTIPNNGTNFSKLVAQSNSDSASRTNFVNYDVIALVYGDILTNENRQALNTKQFHIIDSYSGDNSEGNELSVLFPVHSQNMILTVVNKTDVAVTVYPQDTTTVNDDVDDTIAASSTVTFLATAGNNWLRISVSSN